MADLSWRLPKALEPGRYRVRVSFCDNEWEAMPAEITSQELAVQQR
jgi:hypothetical protein